MFKIFIQHIRIISVACVTQKKYSHIFYTYILIKKRKKKNQQESGKLKMMTATRLFTHSHYWNCAENKTIVWKQLTSMLYYIKMDSYMFSIMCWISEYAPQHSFYSKQQKIRVTYYLATSEWATAHCKIHT